MTGLASSGEILARLMIQGVPKTFKKRSFFRHKCAIFGMQAYMRGKTVNLSYEVILAFLNCGLRVNDGPQNSNHEQIQNSQ